MPSQLHLSYRRLLLYQRHSVKSEEQVDNRNTGYMDMQHSMPVSLLVHVESTNVLRFVACLLISILGRSTSR